MALPSMIRAVMSVPALKMPRILIQRRYQGGRVAGNLHALDAGCVPTDDFDIARWDAEGLGEDAGQGDVRLTFRWRGAHARLQHRAAIGERVDALDRIATALGREA